jgi:hypothetical protein
MELINKSKLLEELKKCEKICEDYMFSHKDAISQGIANAKRAMCQHIIKIINTLEVKEVDFNTEVSKFIDTFYKNTKIGHRLMIMRTAKYFYELGLKTKKGE